MNGFCHTYGWLGWLLCRTLWMLESHIWMWEGPCHAYGWLGTEWLLCRTLHVNETCCTYAWGTSHESSICVTWIDWCHTYGWIAHMCDINMCDINVTWIVHMCDINHPYDVAHRIESCHAYEWVASYIRIQMNQLCLSYDASCIRTLIHVCVCVIHVCVCVSSMCVTCLNTYAWNLIWKRMHTRDLITTHMHYNTYAWRWYVCHTYRWVMSHIWTRHVTYIDESRRTH